MHPHPFGLPVLEFQSYSMIDSCKNAHFMILVMVFGSVIFFRTQQSMNRYSFMVIILGRTTSTKSLQSWKAPFSISFTPWGILNVTRPLDDYACVLIWFSTFGSCILCILLHIENASLPIIQTYNGMFTFSNLTQCIKSPLLVSLMPWGRIASFNWMQDMNTIGPILVTFSGISTLLILRQLVKAWFWITLRAPWGMTNLVILRSLQMSTSQWFAVFVLFWFFSSNLQFANAKIPILLRPPHSFNTLNHRQFLKAQSRISSACFFTTTIVTSCNISQRASMPLYSITASLSSITASPLAFMAFEWEGSYILFDPLMALSQILIVVFAKFGGVGLMVMKLIMVWFLQQLVFTYTMWEPWYLPRWGSEPGVAIVGGENFMFFVCSKDISRSPNTLHNFLFGRILNTLHNSTECHFSYYHIYWAHSTLEFTAATHHKIFHFHNYLYIAYV